MSLVKASHVSKQFEEGGAIRQILKDASFEVAAGQSLAIMGPSGSGKSTLLNIVGTLDKPTSGIVEVFGTNPLSLAERELAAFRNATIGFVFQAHHLLPQCSVLENVLIPTIVKRGEQAGAGGSVKDRAMRLLERVGLTSRMHGFPAQLSGGECQRAAVVRALINAPKVVLADEPTGSLDRASADAIGALLSDLRREENIALIVVTHSDDLAKRMDRILHLRGGELCDS
jgi:ABC-type lipoprotein export system ATPase subunit